MHNNSFYDKNKSYMEKKFPGVGAKLDEYLRQDDDSDVDVFTTRDGQRGFFIRKGNGVIQLNSKYSSRAFADIWAENLLAKEQLSRNHVLLVVGFGNGDYIQALTNKMPKDSILICYEPSIRIFMKAMQEIDIEQVMPEISAVFAEGLNMEGFGTSWRAAVTTMNGSLVHMAVLPNYERLFAESIPYILNLVSENNEITLVMENTRVEFSDVTTKNLVAMLPYFIESYDLTKLFEALPSQVPVIIVAAGPSLNKNIREIRRAKNKALIIAIDTSVKLLLKEGIIPDIYISIDARKPLELFTDPRIHDIPVCVAPFSIPEAIEKQRCRTFVSMGVSYVGRLCKPLKKTFGFLGDGGTVAHNAFCLALEARMSPIILVGQDLAYTNEQTHAKGVDYGSEVEEDDGTIWVEDIYGNPVRTIENLNIYRQWYENVIRTTVPKDIRVIDATEGGAKIDGTEIRSLKEVIEEECTQEYDFKKIIESVPQLFEQKEKEWLREEFRKIPHCMQEILETAEKSVDIYRNIYEHSKDMQPWQIQSLLKQLEELTTQVEERYEYMLVEPYVEEVARDVMKNLDNESENLEDEVKDIARRGLAMAEALVGAVPKAMEEVNKMLAKL